MRVVVLLAALVLPAVAPAAEPAKLYVRAAHSADYNVHAIGPHDLWIANAVGDRTPMCDATTCNHLRPDSRMNLVLDF